ncbi:hypothetical protein NKI56_36160 [Mesorhizobium sp. M0622]|uniref:hypothetical protein n=1 Tax=unclassified Mesorhizobium TaxID=325217 RepID=UPI0033379860
MASNQELFANGLAANQKVIEANYMAHREALWPAAWGPDGRGAGTLRLSPILQCKAASAYQEYSIVG